MAIDPSSKRFKLLSDRFKAVSGYRIPTEMIPPTISFDELEKVVIECEKMGQDVMARAFMWDDPDLLF